MNHDILTVLSGPELTSGRPFPGLTNAAPPPRKVGNDQMRFMQFCRTGFGPQTTYESTSTMVDEYIG